MAQLQHLNFDVIHVTGWDDNYHPQQLLPNDINNDSGIKHGKGWQSEKRCKYPQEIILRVTCGQARVRKLQILSHQYKIASKLEIYVGSIQRRKEIVGIQNNTGVINDEKRNLSWDNLPKIIDNDGISSDDEVFEDYDYVKDDYDLIKTNGGPYIHFRRLGYCALDSNERANYKARELKSVKLDVEGEYIRFVARSCHENVFNQFNQVGIVAIIVMGEPVNYLLAGESQKIPIEHVDEGLSRVASPETCIVPVIKDDCTMIDNNPNNHQNFASLYSILPDSSSVNNSTTSLPDQVEVDRPANPTTSNDFLLNAKGTAQLLSAFDRAKQSAVKVEDFRLAKVLKYAAELIKKSAEDVGKLDSLKKRAIAEEDFDNADKYKREIEAIKTYICSYLEEEGLDLDETGEVIVLDLDPDLADIIGLADDAVENCQQPNNEYTPYVPGVPSGVIYQEKHHVPAGGVLDAPQRQKSRSSSDSSTRISNSSVVHHPSSLHIPISRPDSSSLSIDRPHHPEPVTPTTPIESIQWDNSVEDRPLPALTNIKDNHDYIIPSLPFNDPSEEHPENLSDIARIAFDLAIQYFGEYDVACLLSKKFPLRESALSNFTKRVDVDHGDGKDVEGIDKVGLIKATFQIIKEALEDNPEKLTLQALTLWEIITNFSVHHQIPTSSTWKLVDKTYPLLFGKISDSNSRIKQNSINLFILLARTYNTPVHSAVSLVLKPAKSNSQPPKQSKAKVELVTRLVEEFGIALNLIKGKCDKDLKLNLESVMQVSVSYLNNNNGEVRDSAVKLVVEVIKIVGREKVKDFIIDIKPILLENIWNLVTEYEEATEKIAGQVPSPPPSPKIITEKIKPDIKDLEVNEELIRTPLAQRGTVTRLEQQLMEVKSMFNTTNSFLKDDYSTVIANAAKVIEEPEELTEQELKELEELEAEELLLKNANNVPDSCELPSKAEKTSKKSSTRIGSKPTPIPGKQSLKKSKIDTAPPKRQPLRSSLTSKPVTKEMSSRRDSTEEIKRNSRKGSKSTDAPLCEEPDECEASKSDRCCIFCDEHNENFTEENLVNHYWTECPVLTKCRLCNIILEISTLDDHMLTDCDKAKFVKQCPTCREVVDADDYLAHINKQTCLAIRDDIVRCPLCKTVIKPATEEGWKSHLLNTNGCPKNRRKSNIRPNASIAESSASGGKKHASKKTTEIGSKSSLVSKTPSKSKVTTTNGSSSSKDKLKKSATKSSKVKVKY